MCGVEARSPEPWVSPEFREIFCEICGGSRNAKIRTKFAVPGGRRVRSDLLAALNGGMSALRCGASAGLTVMTVCVRVEVNPGV